MLNQPSLDRFEPLVKTGGTLIYDPYSIIAPPRRTDINIYSIDAMEEAAIVRGMEIVKPCVKLSLVFLIPKPTKGIVESNL